MKLQTIYNRICKLALQGDKFVINNGNFRTPALNLQSKLLQPWFRPMEGKEARAFADEVYHFRFRKNVCPAVLFKRFLRKRLHFLGDAYIEDFYNFIMCLGNSTGDSERYKYMFDFAKKHNLDDSYARIF